MNDLIGKIVVIKRNGTDGSQFPLRTNECLFGRKPECDIRIQLPNVSLEHAVVKVDEKDKQVKIVNLSSTNETLVNGKPISEVEVQHLDVFTISDRSFRFELPSPVLKQRKSPKTQHRRSNSLVSTPQENKTPKMPIAPKGSPRTPPTGGSLKENIHRLRRYSMPLQEEEEALLSPAANKTPLSIISVNPEVQDEPDIHESTEHVCKRKSSREVAEKSRRNSKRVSFGPILSPEQFDKDLPPATPVRRGSTPKRTVFSAKKRRSVLALPTTDSIKEDDDQDSYMIETLDLQKELSPESKTLEQDQITYEVDSHNLECAEMENTIQNNTTLEEKVSGSAVNTLEGGSQPSSRQDTPKSATPKGRRRSSSTLEEKKVSVAYSGVTEVNQVGLETDQPKEKRRSSLRLAEKTPELQSVTPKTATTSYDDDEDIDETILDSDDYTSDEEDEEGKVAVGEGKVTSEGTPLQKEQEIKLEKAKKMATPLRKEIEEGIKLQETKKKMATPLKKEIANGVSLRQTKKKMATPLRKEIAKGVKLQETKKKMATPLKKEIANGVSLRQTKRKMATPLRKEIEGGIKLQETKSKMATPLKKEIANGVSLRQTKRKMNTPLRKEIEGGIKLQETKRKMATPLKKEIANGVSLRQTKRKMNTPLREEIEEGTKLQETKKKMATPLKKEITNGVSLRQTKRKMATPLRKEIEDGFKLQETKRRIATPLQKEIIDGISLRQTKKKMATPLRKEISEGATLGETKKKLQTPIRKAIEEGVTLRATKNKLSTPLRKAIQAKPALRQTKLTMNVLLQDEIKQGVKLRTTKQSMPLEVQIEIIKGKKLKSTKKSLPTPVKKAISGGVTLRKTKKSLPTPLKEEIKRGVALQKTKESLPTPVRKQLEGGIPLKQTAKSSKRKRSESGLNEHEAKRLKTSPSEEVTEASEELDDAPVRRALKTPLRKAIIAGRKLRPTRHRMATPLRKQIHSKPVLRAIRRKSTTVREEMKPRKPTYAEIVKRPKKTSVRRSSRGPSFKLGKTAAVFSKAEDIPVVKIADAVATNAETPKAVSEAQSNQKRRSVRLERKATPQTAMVDSSGAPNSPATNETAQKSTWMSSLARATKGVKARATSVEDFEGLAEMFATPPTVALDNKDIFQKQKGSKWLSSLAKATKAPRKRAMPVEHFEGVAEMFATPPSTFAVTPRNAIERNGDTSTFDEQELQVTESLKPSQTPSLRSFGKDAEFVEVLSPIQSTRTPSLRSRNKQTVKTAVTPEVTLELKEVLKPQKTSSLRSSAEDAVTVQVVTPLQPSRTPSLLSAKQQTSVLSTESPDVEMDFVQPIAPSKTPSMRSSAQVKAVSENSVKKPSTSGRKSLGLQGLARLMKSPKEHNGVENAEDFFAPNLFASPKPQPKRYSRKSEGLQGVARLLRGPAAKNEEAAAESPKLGVIKAMMQTGKAVASPNFVGLRTLMRTPKASDKEAVHPEEHFSSELFTSPARDSSQDSTETAGQDECDKKQDIPVINLISPESQEKTAAPRATRAKRKAPEQLTEPVPKRVRSTRAAAKQVNGDKTETRSKPKTALKMTTTRSKKSTAANLQNTPKPLVFKRTKLDPIIEVLSPLPSLDQAVEIATSPELIEANVAEKASHGRSSKKETEAKVQSKEPVRSSRRGNRAKAKVESCTEESSEEEFTEKRTATRSRTSGKGHEISSSNSETQKAGLNSGKTRSTRSTQLEEAPSQNVPPPSRTRASRNQRAEVEKKDVDSGVTEETVNNPTTRRTRRAAKTTVECAPVVAEKKTTRRQKAQEKNEETLQLRSTRSRRGPVNESKAVDEDKLLHSSQAKRSTKESVEKLDEKVKSEEIEAPAEHRSTRRTRGNPAEKAIPERESVPSDDSAKKPRAKREPKGKTPEEPRKTRSTRNAKPTKTELEAEVKEMQPVRSTRGTKRHLREEDAGLATPEAKRTRSSARQQSVQAPKTRSLRSRK